MYLEMIRLKTSVLIAAALEIGAVCGGAAEKDASLMYQSGLNLGMAFQIQDDLLDLYGDQDKFGKKPGGDVLLNKKTFLLVSALEKANKETAVRINELMDKENDPDIKVREFKKYLMNWASGQLQKARQKAISTKHLKSLMPQVPPVNENPNSSNW
jgi:geranylgeranyl diphosphate synthase, type II